MSGLPAGAGWNWIKQGFALFRRQPVALSMLFIMYFFLTLVLSGIPAVGWIVRFALVPTFSMVFMRVCADIELGKQVHPKALFAWFRSPAFKSLLFLGLFYPPAVFLAVLSANIVSNGALWQVMNSDVAPDAYALQESGLASAVFFGGLVYLLITLPLWFAAPLIAWQNMRVGKAIFFSFFTVVRTIKAFLAYLAASLAIALVTLSVVSSILSLLVGYVDSLMLLPFVMILMTIGTCSNYPSYTQIFGTPPLPEDG